MASGKKKKSRELDHADVLKGKVSVTMRELIKMIHRVNPSGESFGSEEKSERYKTKTALQSLLVRRFRENLIVEQPEPENPRLVGFRLRNFDEDACHAMIDELDADARAWTQRQIDEARFDNPLESTEIPTTKYIGKPSKETPPNETPSLAFSGHTEETTLDELIRSGKRFLAEYDYDSCETEFRRAIEVAGDDPAPAIFLLELYVDHLAAYDKALDLANALPMSVKINDSVKVFLALAAARNGRIDSALEYIKRQTQPRASEVYLAAGKHFVQRGDHNRASLLLKELESFGQVELESEMKQLGKQVHALFLKSHEPVEQEMILARQQGRTEDALKLAEKILFTTPENRSAQRILQEIKKQQRDERVNTFLRLADEAKINNDFTREMEFLNKAIAGGASAEKFGDRLEYARNEARKKNDEMEIQSVLHLLAEESWSNAFSEYIGLTEKQRSRVKEIRHDRHLVWLDQILARATAPKPGKLVEAVLMLGKCKDALETKTELGRIAEDLEPHAKVLQSISEARDIVQKAEILLKIARHNETKELLDHAARFLETGEIQNARSSMHQIQESLLPKDDKVRFDRINLELQHREKQEKLEQSYRGSLERKDHLVARKIAGDLARHTDRHSAEEWLAKLDKHNAQIEREWSLKCIDIDDLPMYYASIGLNLYTERVQCCLLQDQRHLVIASSHEEWVFLRILCLEEQAFKKAIILRTPRLISLAKIYPVANALWLLGNKGDVLELGLEPLAILSWYDYASYAKEGEIIDDVWMFPKSKSLWLSKHDRGSHFGNATEVFDLDRQRGTRQVKASSHPAVVNAGGDWLVIIQNLITKAVSLYSEQGKFVESFAFKINQTAHCGTLHPNGKDFIFLPFNEFSLGVPTYGKDAKEEDNLLLKIEVRPDLLGTYQPFRIEDSNGEQQHSIFTSLETAIIFIEFTVDNAKGFERVLAAFKEVGHRFERLYQVPFPKRSALALDEFSKQVVGINFQGDQVQAVVLDESPPVFNFEIKKPFGRVLPDFQADYFICNHPRGAIGELVQGLSMRIRECSVKELNDLIKEMKQSGTDPPEKIAAFIYVLGLHQSLLERADEVRAWMQTRYPSHFTVLQRQAEEAAREKNWPEVVALLEIISRKDLPDGSARHICHLLGMGYFIAGKVEKALNLWLEGMKDEGGECNLNPYIEYARLSLMPAAERKKKNGDIPEALELIESLDNYFADKKWEMAIEALEKRCDSESIDLHLLARLAWAYLHTSIPRGGKQWFFKVVALGNYCEKFQKKFRSDSMILPPFIKTWPENRMSEVAKQAKQWLDEQNTLGEFANET